MFLTIPESWDRHLSPVYAADDSNPAFCALSARVEEAYRTQTVYPPEDRLFSALALTPPERVRCVILGQDPYHEPGQAMGLSFSVPDGVPLPPSLRNIYRELAADLVCDAPDTGSLVPWAEQGVLLLNTVLTVQAGTAGSHRKYGWQDFTRAVIASLARLTQPVAAILWGKDAQAFAPLLSEGVGPRMVLCAPHPSPLSAYRGFFGSRPFGRVNTFLTDNGALPIHWV